jgi:hypothetical protein
MGLLVALVPTRLLSRSIPIIGAMTPDPFGRRQAMLTSLPGRGMTIYFGYGSCDVQMCQLENAKSDSWRHARHRCEILEKALRKAERELDAATTRTALDAGAKKFIRAKAELKRLEVKFYKGGVASNLTSAAASLTRGRGKILYITPIWLSRPPGALAR